MNKGTYDRFPEFRQKLIKLGRPAGEHLLWQPHPELSEAENALCELVWYRYRKTISIRRADRLKFEELYKKVFADQV